MREVAQLAGVSVTTVSHVLSGKRPVHDTTADRVRRVVAETGYVPDAMGRSLQSGRSDVVGMLVPDIRNDFYAEIVRAAEDMVFAGGRGLMVCNTAYDDGRETTYLDIVGRGLLDGLIYAAGSLAAHGRLAALSNRLPIVLIDEDVPGMAGASQVRADHAGGGVLAARHLRWHGHTKAVALAGPRELASGVMRLDGFVSAFSGEVEVVHGRFTRASGFEMMTALCRRGLDATAVFAANDLMALGALAALQQAGVRVPEDVSVVGFDDIRESATAVPQLTTVRQPSYRIGASAAEELLREIDRRPTAPPAPSMRVFDVELTVRGSTGPGPQRGG